MPKIRVLAQAARELQEAAAWYESEQDGLGARLLVEFERGIDLLKDELPPLTPMPAAAGAAGARKLLLHRFPFAIIVIESGGEIVVIAVAHQSRRPGYWASRIGA